MYLGGRRMFGMFFGGHNGGPEQLDRPVTNFDTIGVPTKEWSSGFFSCFQNIMPSCVMSFLCPCVMFGQVVIRAQIPIFISLKNSFTFCGPQTSGYGKCVDYFFWTLVLGAGLIALLLLVELESSLLVTFLVIMTIIVLAPFIYLNGILRNAFREKYLLPGCLPGGCGFWQLLLDFGTCIACFPCSISQMARHVFQYEKMDTPVTCFMGDPYFLPPLRPIASDIEHGEGMSSGTSQGAAAYRRPDRADEAGMHWLNNNRAPGARDNTGAAHRQEELARQQRQQMVTGTPIAGAAPPGVPIATVAPVTGVQSHYHHHQQQQPSASNTGVIYNADGTIAH